MHDADSHALAAQIVAPAELQASLSASVADDTIVCGSGFSRDERSRKSRIQISAQ